MLCSWVFNLSWVWEWQDSSQNKEPWRNSERKNTVGYHQIYFRDLLAFLPFVMIVSSHHAYFCFKSIFRHRFYSSVLSFHVAPLIETLWNTPPLRKKKSLEVVSRLADSQQWQNIVFVFSESSLENLLVQGWSLA